jgi:uncharacterized membrane protein
MHNTSGITIAVVAHLIVALTLVWDKILLGDKQTQSIIGYVFWFGILSAFGPFLAFFGLKLPEPRITALALASGGLYVASNYFYFVALSRGESSQAVPIMGGLSPVATALIGLPLLHTTLSGKGLWGFSLLVAGSLLMSFTTQLNLRAVLPFAALSAGLFGLTNVCQKIAFDHAGFLAGYVFFTTGIFLFSLLFLVRSDLRRDIAAQLRSMSPAIKRSYFANRSIERIGSLLIFLAISRANPALVEALGGLRYAVVFLAAYLITKYHPRWLCERFSARALAFKSLATAAVIAGLILVSTSESSQ